MYSRRSALTQAAAPPPRTEEDVRWNERWRERQSDITHTERHEYDPYYKLKYTSCSLLSTNLDYLGFLRTCSSRLSFDHSQIRRRWSVNNRTQHTTHATPHTSHHVLLCYYCSAVCRSSLLFWSAFLRVTARTRHIEEQYKVLNVLCREAWTSTCMWIEDPVLIPVETLWTKSFANMTIGGGELCIKVVRLSRRGDCLFLVSVYKLSIEHCIIETAALRAPTLEPNQTMTTSQPHTHIRYHSHTPPTLIHRLRL